VNVARPYVERVVQSRANEPYGLARIFADRTQGQIPRAPGEDVFPRLGGLHRVERGERLLVPVQVCGEVGPVDENELIRLRDPLRQPGLEGPVERIRKRDEQLVPAIAEGNGTAVDGLGIWNDGECRHTRVEIGHTERRVMEHPAETRNRFMRLQPEPFLEHLNHRALRGARLRPRLSQFTRWYLRRQGARHVDDIH
jgi:hypothetical protein